MPPLSPENLQLIRFEGELLPHWAQLLDLASRLCPVSEETRRWFSTFTSSNGVDDARTVRTHCELLRAELLAHHARILSELQAGQQNQPATQVCAAWLYALDTMLAQTAHSQTCSWLIEGSHHPPDHAPGDDGTITLRRV